jgi:hypothetical protein
MWPEVCSEGTTYDVAFAAAPYLVGIANQVTPVESIQYLIVLGLSETYAGAVPEDLKPTYRQAVSDALALALKRLEDCAIDHELRYLLGAVAAFRSRADLASVLQDLDAIEDVCPSCGTVVFSGDLQQVINRDRREAGYRRSLPAKRCEPSA